MPLGTEVDLGPCHIVPARIVTKTNLHEQYKVNEKLAGTKSFRLLCKSFLFLLVNLIAVSLHCSNYIGKTSHHFR